MRIYIYYILGMLAGFLYSVPVYSAITTSEHLTNLQILIDNNLPYTQNITADSIILWEKELEPQLERQAIQHSFPFETTRIRCICNSW